MKVVRPYILILSLVFVLGFVPPCMAQQPASPPQPAKPAPVPQKRRPITPATAKPVIVETVPNAPQVVTLLHRLSGLKMFRLLVRSGEARAIGRIDEQFRFDREVHTNVIAGLALDDGQTFAAWLPEVDAELGPPPPTKVARPATQASSPGTPPEPATSIQRRFRFAEPPNLTVVTRDVKAAATYVGLDGVTGLSILKLGQEKVYAGAEIGDAAESSITVGQRVHLFAPEPVNESSKDGAIYARIGETDASITDVMRAPSGGIARVQIESPKLSSANIGGVVLNDAGQTVGIIDTVKAGQATVLPTTLIRGAAKRVLARQASVPRPWLGILGEPVGAMPLEQLLRNGWQPSGARTLAEEQRGILLTSVLPGSPASIAALRPGDVILRANEGDVRNAQEFSWVLEEAGPGGSVRFTVARPGQPGTEAIDVKLSESPDPFFGLRTPGAFGGVAGLPAFATANQHMTTASLLANGMETITLLPKVAARLGSGGGLLVVYVEPATAAFKAGLRVGDVIESINGQLLTTSQPININEPGTSYSFSVVRNKQKMVISFVAKEKS
jgi:S1-C subfamily serine protease